MSFSNETKNELSRIQIKDKCCLIAELSGLLRMGGLIVIKSYSMGVNFSTENAALARRVLQLLKSSFKIPIEISVIQSRKLKKKNRYLLKIKPSKETASMISTLGLVDGKEGEKIEQRILKSACCKRAFLRGVFLAGGSMSRPTGEYHLEIVSQSEDLAFLVLKIMKNLGVNAKITDRKDDHIVYIKEGDAIVRFLTIIGAHSALLEFENVRILKDMRNHVNRVVNCETANIAKVAKAAVKQLLVINYIDEVLGLHKLSPPLYEAAILRKENPEASLSELAEKTEDKIKKTGINHRFRRLQKIAESLGMESMP